MRRYFAGKIQNLESDWSKRSSRQTTVLIVNSPLLQIYRSRQILSHVGRRKATKAGEEDQEASFGWRGEEGG